VATVVESAAGRGNAVGLRFSRLGVLEAWHLLSLDAPTVAALWSCFFARAIRVELPWHAPAILAIGTWLIYVADRMLDGYRKPPATLLQQRHRFHTRYRGLFLLASLPAAAFLIALIVTRMTANARREDMVLFLIALLYLFLVHRPQGVLSSRLPKELAVGVVFAAATAVPVWSRLSAGRATILPAIALFALLCWLNCVAIERWESGPGNLDREHSTSTTLWTVRHVPALAVALTASCGLVGMLAVRQSSSTAPLYLAMFGSCTVFLAIDRERERFSTLSLRILADVALLTPLLAWPFLA
jgi:hypothetical protein